MNVSTYFSLPLFSNFTFMSDLQLYSEFHSLPEELRKEVADFIKFLKAKKLKSKKLRERKFGALKARLKSPKILTHRWMISKSTCNELPG